MSTLRATRSSCFVLLLLPSVGCGGSSKDSGQPQSAAQSAQRGQQSTAGASDAEGLKRSIAAESDKLKSNANDANAYFERGRLRRKLAELLPPAERSGAAREAIADLLEADKKSGTAGHAKALLEAARVYLAGYQVDDARRLINRATQLDPDDPEIRAANVQIRALADGRWDSAIDALKKILDEPRASKLATVWGNLGFAHQAARQFPDAERAYRRALELDPDSRGARVNLGLVLDELGKRDEAQELMRGTLNQNRNELFAANNLGSSLCEQGKYQEAFDVLSPLVESAPTFPAGWYNLGRAYGGLGRTDEAVRCFRRAIQLVPNYADAYHAIGLTLAEAGRDEEAISEYRKALKLEPNAANVLYDLANSLGRSGKNEEAIETYAECTRLAPNDSRAWNNLGIQLQSLKRTDEARSAYQRAIETDPRNDRAHSNFGDLETASGRYSEAIQHYRESLALNHQAGGRVWNLYGAFLLKDDLAGALKEAERLIADDPQVLAYRNFRAAVNTEMGKFDAALEEMTSLMKSDSGAAVRRDRGLAYLRMGRIDDALADFKRALRIDPTDTIAVLYDWSLKRCAGRTDEAAAVLRTALEKTDSTKRFRILFRYLNDELNAADLIDGNHGKLDDGTVFLFVGEKTLAVSAHSVAKPWFEKAVAAKTAKNVEFVLARWRIRQTGS